MTRLQAQLGECQGLKNRVFAGKRAVSSVGRAPARQAGGHWFEPSTAHSVLADSHPDSVGVDGDSRPRVPEADTGTCEPATRFGGDWAGRQRGAAKRSIRRLQPHRTTVGGTVVEVVAVVAEADDPERAFRLCLTTGARAIRGRGLCADAACCRVIDSRAGGAPATPGSALSLPLA
jgi:hypothetical protein